jgi:hypothetical protein
LQGYELEQIVRTGSEDEFDILHINIVDLEATKQLVEAGKVLDVHVVDHLVIGHHTFVSLKERLHW